MPCLCGSKQLPGNGGCKLRPGAAWGALSDPCPLPWGDAVPVGMCSVHLKPTHVLQLLLEFFHPLWLSIAENQLNLVERTGVGLREGRNRDFCFSPLQVRHF